MRRALSKKSFSSPSLTVTLNSLAASKKKSGETIYNFAAGEPVIPYHPAVEAALKKGLEQKFVPYAPIKGIVELRKAAVDWMNRTYCTHYALDNAIVTTGGKYALFAALQSLIDAGDEILIAAPYWVSYPEMVRLCGGLPVVFKSQPEKGWKITPEQIKEFCTGKTKGLLFNNACNPTGALYNRQELKQILEAAHGLGLYVISDEVYSELTYTKEFVSCGALLEFSASTIVVQSCSKNFAMSGWRVGFAFAPEEIIEAIALFQGHMTTGTSTASQWAALGALENAEEIAAHIRLEMKQRRDFCCSLMGELFQMEIPVPEASLYLFLSLKQLKAKEQSSTEYCMRVLKNNNVVLVPGEAFGQDKYVRLAFSSDLKEIEAGLHALRAANQEGN